jgi:hypothetical protein
MSESTEKITDYDRFHPESKLTRGVEADKVARYFTASVTSAYKLATSKVTLPDENNDFPGLDRVLKHKRRLRKLCKTAVNWVTKPIRRMTHKKALERWGKK